MAEKKGLPYKAQSGDTEESIVKKFKVPGWQIIYDYSENTDYRKKRPIPQKIQAGDKVIIPPEYVIPCTTGQQITVTQKGMRVFFDAHMHIQSNNCSSLPIQWAVVSKAAVFDINGLRRGRIPFSTIKRANRKELAEINSKALTGFLADLKAGRLIEIGRLPTDLIADLYMHALKDENLRKDDAWIVMTKKEYEAYARETDNTSKHSETSDSTSAMKEKQKSTPSEAKLGKRAKLSQMSTDSAAKYSTFINALKSYSGEDILFRIQCAQTFDLTFAHYWGHYGIPIYFPDKNGRILFINDYIQAGILNMQTFFKTVVLPGVYIPRFMETGIEGLIYHLYAKQILDKEFSFNQQFERFCMWQDPVLDPRDSIRPWFFMRFDGDRNKIKNLLKRDYVHLVEPVLPDPADCVNEEKWIEPYFKKQLPLSEASAVKYPFNFLLFYHYDPRSHFKGDASGNDARASELADKIIKEHAFFTYRIEKSKMETYKNDFGTKIQIEDRLVLSPTDELNTVEFWKKTIQQMIRSNKSVFSRLLQKSDAGIYWGIKMYPRFGYDPADFRRYPQLEELYDTCVQSNIPILSHCSEGGMIIADYYNYIRYDIEKNTAPDEYNLEDAARDVTNRIAAPANWRKVLENYPKLKIDIAHFGSYCIWKDIESFRKMDSSPKSNKASEKAFRYQNWVDATGALIQDYENVYTDLSCFTLTDDFSEQKRCADNLVFLLNKYSKLKEHLLIGTDWPLTETDPSLFDKLIGIGDYMNRMMVVLREVSNQMNYDAFHQFGYINQLRFLGLLDETGSEKKVKVDVLKDYRERLIKLIKGSDKINKSDITNNTNPIIDKLTKNPKIPASEDIKSTNGKLAIFNYEDYEVIEEYYNMGLGL